MNMTRWIFVASLASSVLTLAGCDDSASAPATGSPQSKAKADDHAHTADGGHPAATAAPATAPAGGPVAGHGGAVIQLGSATAGAFQLTATRDQGSIEAGKDAPIDVTVTPVSGSTARVAAVRFWIGTADAKGSVKAKAEVENPAEPNRWHTHTEIPNPLPADSKLYVEVEAQGEIKSVASFDLKQG